MKRLAVWIGIVAGSLVVAGTAASAGDASGEPGMQKHRSASHGVKKKKPQVRGFVARRGGYSYDQSSVINTYGDSGQHVAPLQFRDPRIDRQALPFDNGFFYDSGILPRGGSSPYMN